MQSKTEQINIRLSTDEKKALKVKATLRGYSNLSEFLLVSIIKPERINQKKTQNICEALNRIGNNINQIARRANQEKGNLKTDILQSLAVIDELMTEILNEARK